MSGQTIITLGNTRLTTAPGGNVVDDSSYAPFGQQYPGTPINGFFTGVAQSAQAPDIKDFPARNYQLNSGRWLTRDPAGIAAVDLTNPQSLNRYAYALNNPLSNVDPTGLESGAPAYDHSGCGWNILCLIGRLGQGIYEGASSEGTYNNPIDQHFAPIEQMTVNYFGPVGGINSGTVGTTTSTSVSVPPKSKTCAAITPPSGPINYVASAQRNAQMGLGGWYQAFKGGGTQDFKGNSAFGTRANQAAAGNFNFGASVAAKGWSLFTAQALAGTGALLSNLNSQGGYALAQSAYMQGQYGGPSSPNPGSGAPAWNMGPGFPGFPVVASNGIPTQGDQVAPYENAAVVAGYSWYSLGCY